MDAQTAISLLRDATAPSRELDAAIAQAIGWTKHAVVRPDPNTGAQTRVVLWLVPKKDDYARVPYYTYILDDAQALVESLVPKSTGGFSWEKGKASARINDGPYVEAATPAIALCIAALSYASLT